MASKTFLFFSLVFTFDGPCCCSATLPRSSSSPSFLPLCPSLRLSSLLTLFLDRLLSLSLTSSSTVFCPSFVSVPDLFSCSSYHPRQDPSFDFLVQVLSLGLLLRSADSARESSGRFGEVSVLGLGVIGLGQLPSTKDLDKGGNGPVRGNRLDELPTHRTCGFPCLPIHETVLAERMQTVEHRDRLGEGLGADDAAERVRHLVEVQ